LRCGEPLEVTKHGALFWLAVAGGGVVLLGVGGYLAMLFMIIGSEESDVAETFVLQSADVRKAVGGEPEVAWLRDGSITSTDSVNGKARFVLTATGPKGEAKVVVNLMRSGSAWGITQAGIIGGNGSVSAISRDRVRAP
jgi:hypothetical protein